MFMAFKLKRETHPDRMRTLLELSSFALPIMYGSLIVLVLAGIGAGIMGNWFAMGWVWAAIVLLAGLAMGMWLYATYFYAPVRQALGLPYRTINDNQPPVAPASDTEILAAVAATSPILLAAISFTLIGIILWLMMFKPF